MQNYVYSAITSAGETVKGRMEAATPAEVVSFLQRRGQFPVTVSAAGDSGLDALRKLLPARRVKRQALALATHELASLLPAGLPLDKCLGLVIQLTDDALLKGVFTKITEKVKGGMSFGTALESEPETFPRFYVSLVRSGEASGSLEPTLVQLGDYLQKAQTTRDQVKSALIYPALLLVAATLSVGFILVGVLPQFKPFFTEAGASLPVPTQIVMAIGDFLTAWGWLLLLVLGGSAVGFRQALKRPDFRLWWDGVVLKSPGAGTLITKSETARFSRTLGTLIKGGLPLPTALNLACETLTNTVMIAVVRDTLRSLREGENLSSLLMRAKIFPSLATQLIRVGEETGQLEEMLLHQAGLFERDVGRSVDRIFSALTPLITIGLGVVVAGIIGSVMLAILKVNDLAG